jgi:hypothetical protein
LGAGILEDITIRNYSQQPAACDIALSVDADFADLFEVKDRQFHRQWEQTRRTEDGLLKIEAFWQGVRKDIIVRASGCEVSTDGLLFHADIPAQEQWSDRATVVPEMGDVAEGLLFQPVRIPFLPKTGGSRPGLRPSLFSV